MLIVIEGVDRTGKTTLAHRIAYETGMNAKDVVHAGVPKLHPLEEYETKLDGFDPRSHKRVLDRWHIGEYVWPKIFNRETEFDNVGIQRHLDMFMQSRGMTLVYALRDPAKIKTSLVANDEPLDPNDLETAMFLFELATQDRLPFFWDFEVDNSSETVGRIIKEARWRAEGISRIWDACGPGWIGTPWPNYLLVGDELGPEKEGRNPPDDIPFAPYTGTSGAYLMQLDLRWDKYSIVNAHENRTGVPRDLFKVWKAFESPRVVALGARAAAELKRQGVPFKQVPHPQYWRRFRHHDVDEYTNMIKENVCF